MKKTTIAIIAIIIAIGIISVFILSKDISMSKKQRGELEERSNQTTQQLLQPTKTIEDGNINEIQEKTKAFAVGMMLHTTGTILYYGQETGGDPTNPNIPPPELIISIDDSPIEEGVRILDTGCVDNSLFYGDKGDKVVVSGRIVKIIPDIGIILTCEQGAHVERLDN